MLWWLPMRHIHSDSLFDKSFLLGQVLTPCTLKCSCMLCGVVLKCCATGCLSLLVIADR